MPDRDPAYQFEEEGSMPSCLSIMVPFFTGREFLTRAIHSVLRQNEPHWRLVVVDDHSKESGIADLVASFDDPRISYQRNSRNLGMAGNWNRCLDLAETDLVTLLHADDELLPDYCQQMRLAAERFPKTVAFHCRTKVVNKAGKRRLPLPDLVKFFLRTHWDKVDRLQGEQGVVRLLRGNFVFCPTMCFQKMILGNRRFVTSWRMVQDLEMWTRLLLEGETIIGLPSRSYAYRRHGKNATDRYVENSLRFLEEIRLYHELEERLQDIDWTNACRTAQLKRILKLSLLYHAARDFVTMRFRGALEKLSILKGIL